MSKENNRAKKTVNLSSRIDVITHSVLTKDAERKGISLNSLISSIFKRYIAWERYSDEIGVIPLYKQTIRRIFDNIDEKTAKQIGADVGSTIPRDLTALMFNKINFTNVISMIEISSSRFGVVKHEIAGSKHIFTIYHGLCPRFSQYLTQLYASMGDDLSLKINATIVDKNLISFEIEEFDVNDSNGR